MFSTQQKDVLLDHRTAPDWDQSGLFKQIYESEYGTFGGEPFGLLVGDYYCSRSQTDLEFFTAVSLGSFSCSCSLYFSRVLNYLIWNHSQISMKPKSLERMFNSVDFANWNTFRSKEESKYVCLTMPKRYHA